MIPVLFKANAMDFSTYGIGVLADCISCEVTEERNGAYELVLQYPVTGGNYGELSSERIIKAKPNDTADDQAFRIYRITTPIDGVVTVYAQHISYLDAILLHGRNQRQRHPFHAFAQHHLLGAGTGKKARQPGVWHLFHNIR